MDQATAASIEDLVAAERLPAGFREVVDQVHQPLAEQISRRRARLGRPILVGLCGPQGSGKSTAAAVMRLLLEAQGWRTAVLSIDDVYLPRTERTDLARRVHPLLATRGPPGTHDIGLLDRVVAALLAGEDLSLPSFDKAIDDRRPMTDWPRIDRPADVVVLEGWCVGAAPQAPGELAEPVNALERDEDREGVWRGFVNAALESYQPVFARIDLLIQMRPPDFAIVVRWRREQEAKLRLRAAGRPSAQVMTDAQVDRFVQHYERLTRRMLREMPARADIVVDLDSGRRLRRLHIREA